jgi:DNA polymerase-3 subunit delta
LVAEHLGEDAGRLGGLVSKLVTAYGEGAKITAEQVEPFLGDAGSVPRWELTDAIEKGDAATALDKLHRMLDGGGLHPLQLMATLQGWVGRLMRLDGSGASSEKQAAEILGMKGSTFPARKALDTARRFRHDGIVRAVQLVADADIALRGGQAWPDELVMEVLVSRLARLAKASR